MSEKEFYKNILENFFEELEWNIDEFARMVKYPLHIFGEVGYEVNEIENGKLIKILDIDEADYYIAPKDADIKREDVCMVTVALKFEIDKNGYITIIYTNTGMFTRANKEAMLFVSSLIGKKIVL